MQMRDKYIVYFTYANLVTRQLHLGTLPAIDQHELIFHGKYLSSRMSAESR